MTRRTIRSRTLRTHGFTLIEVMIAVGIITVGSLGILAMQSATIRGNAEARQMSMATQRTRTWMDRLERDALTWNRAGAEAANRNQTRFLQNVTAPTAVPVFAAPVPEVESTGSLLRPAQAKKANSPCRGSAVASVKPRRTPAARPSSYTTTAPRVGGPPPSSQPTTSGSARSTVASTGSRPSRGAPLPLWKRRSPQRADSVQTRTRIGE